MNLKLNKNTQTMNIWNLNQKLETLPTNLHTLDLLRSFNMCKIL